MFKDAEALIVLSGGQDSTTCLYWAKQNFKNIKAITFDYGQRHKIELESAQKIADIAGIEQFLVPIDSFKYLCSNSLTSTEVPVTNDTEENGLPNTFVPGRNLIFLTFAASFAYQKGIRHLVTGVCETDFSGYPDCRQSTIEALENSISLGMDTDFKIHTPLMFIDKAASVKLAQDLGAMEAMAYSHTCYNGEFPPCMKCPACILREKGFQEAGIPDPIHNRKN